MLNVDNAAEFLIRRGFITAHSVIDGDLEITSSTRRNRNLRVTSSDSGNYLIKQPNDPEFEDANSLRWEAAFYSFCQQEPAVSAVRSMMPRVVYADQDKAMLVLELLRDTLPIWRYYRQQTAADFPLEAAALVGRSLGILHHTFSTPDLLEDSRLSFLHRKIPWVMRLNRPSPDVLGSVSQASYKIIEILQTYEGLSQHIDEACKLWQPQSLIHGDIRLDNILVKQSDEKDNAKGDHLYLVDWELVQIGDPAWDLAGALQDFIFFWVLSMPHDVSPEKMASEARYPLPILQTALRSLWRGYCEEQKLAPAEARGLMRRAVCFSALRLIQTAYEAASHFHFMPPPSVLTFQVGANILSAPEEAQSQLYGLLQEGNEQ